MRRTCTHCQRRLPEDQFPLAGGKRRGACRLCDNDVQRMRAPLAPVRVDAVQVRLNNLACLWFGPARRETPRNAA
ncbi:hypothetical protein [Xanthomonas translucens]|uniref:hypothetical protein n=1 Tax=Xanthomonas campestris pv. translucens TaxID=343 RepID=UPI00071B2350|nr:hypothetical protein [Xanthomonas translucens]AVY67201.1 hypothetical protein NZ30_13000 [Xanthomonas translucens pv. undulosa]MCT8281802.1 hypothetical protein [Xanthomonas translucens pv. undulosa]MCT8316444.1 hypothetical protein [Xanthomonas translucens pv. undulosa]UKE38313.1 hypothetical protein KCU58_11110 [Xanthomonas translucens pv. undulosa]